MNTHSFDVDIATHYGMAAAILLQSIAFWISKNRANKKNYHDGRYWTYMSLSAFAELFPYLGLKQIRGALSKLKSEGLIITGCYSKTGKLNTTWYALTDKGERIAYQKSAVETPCQNDTTPCQNDTTPCQNDTTPCQNGRAKTDLNTDIINISNTDTDIDDDVHRTHEKGQNSASATAKRVLAALGQQREPTIAETALCEKWMTEYGMQPDVIEAACGLMLGAVNQTFGYLQKVIDTLHNNHVVCIEELESYMRDRERADSFSDTLFKRAGITRMPTATQRERVQKWREEFHLADNLLELMADKAKRQVRPFDYMCIAAVKLHDSDVISIEHGADQAHRILDSVSVPSGYSGQSSSQVHTGYMKHNYTDEELSHIGINFDDFDEEE